MQSVPPMHFADWFSRHAVTRARAAAIVTPNTRLTYADFHRALHVAAHRLAAMGVARGQTVALAVNNQALHCVLIAALNRMGVISLSLPPVVAKAPLSLPGEIANLKVIIEEPFPGVAPDNAVPTSLGWLNQESGKDWEGPGFGDENEIVRIFATSGTTGIVKLVGLSTRALEDRFFLYSIGVLAEARTGATVSQLGLRSATGFRGAFANFWSGATLYLGWPERHVPGLIARHRIQRIEASPVQYRAITSAAAKEDLDLSSLRTAWAVGSTTPKPLIGAIRSRLCRTLVNIYGSTEVGLMAFGLLTAGTAPEVAGVLPPWIQAEAVDDEDRPLAAGSEGILRFRGAGSAKGYVGDPAATSLFFRKGWFYPGDTGTVSATRLLSVKGRDSDQINAGGVKVAPQIVEEVVALYRGIEECAAFGALDAKGVERIWMAIVTKEGVDLAQLAAHCRQKLAARAPHRFLKLEQIPRNENGKVMRNELRKLAAERLREPERQRSA